MKISRIDIIGQNGPTGEHYEETIKKNMNDYEHYIFLSRYSRWRDDLGRRETWDETVQRYVDFFQNKFPDIDDSVWKRINDSILSFDVMPSMRCLMTAGPALEKDNVAGYNCAGVVINRQRVFDEIMYVLMCGTGEGFSVERQFISQLPTVAEELHDTNTVIRVRDSKIGWAASYRELLSLLYSGQIPKWDLSAIRPAGARLKTFGGRASGPGPLEDLFRFTIQIFRGAVGRKLTSLECHDLVCKIADIVVVGGVRRSALISLSNLTDERMQRAKLGDWSKANRQRSLANNSVCYTEQPDIGIFMKEWGSLYESRAGERGIFSREACKKHIERLERRDPEHDFITNPCSEIILRDRQFCNLSEVVVRPTDTFDTLRDKVELATIIGTFQSTLTDFRYLSKKWKENCEEERLLGVSLTGIMDHEVLSGKAEFLGIKSFRNTVDGNSCTLPEVLEDLKEHAIETNKEWSGRLGIPASTATTCVKPSGTVSQLCSTSSGIHPRYSPYYIRRVRSDNKDPLCQLMKDQGIPNEPEAGKEQYGTVFNFPIVSPDHSVIRNDLSAIDQLELWKIYAKHWCEHKPSITVYVRESEWLKVGAWVYENFDLMSGVSFLPFDDHIYTQAPYEEINEDTYLKLKEEFPKEIDWSKLVNYESDDNTTSSQELSCTAGGCEL